ncbi:uncharacterized protein LOC122666133 isoform X3 [Telopea speciosissima]|uniref:uncharacterized protein LOC122666133 isoform X3 n=1 Tax=Telopea speciosissima TaxID=54955 RepID=UPI001CC6FA95|nr:uncharacterized protein LOC122666133 isoform X3 [Telopea speciosissima]
MFSSQILTGLNTLHSRSNVSLSAQRSNNAFLRIRSCSLRLQEIPTELPIHSLGPQLKIDASPSSQHRRDKPNTKEVEERGSPTPSAKAGGEGEGIPEVCVPRQKYISVSKSELLHAILSMFGSQVDVDEFLRLSSVSVATRFQHAFMKLLCDAQFEELSVRDLLLTSALNTDYLLTLPINVDWKKASASNAIIFRRGYATERQQGLLVVEKLDYLQSKLLQKIFFILSKPLGKVGLWINEALKNASQTGQVQIWAEKVKHWFKESIFYPESYSYDESVLDNQLGVGKLSESDLPIWLAAQRAVSRYEGLLSSIGPRRRLLRKFLMWIGLIPSKPETSVKIDGDHTTSETYQRPIFLSRRSLSDIWRPATSESCGSNPWKILKSAVSILFSQSVLQEPAFQELILLYNEEIDQSRTEAKVEFPSLQLKIYERIPIPDLPVVFPHKKLSFRILDTVRLDIATILGLLAYFVNYKFEDILSSP